MNRENNQESLKYDRYACAIKRIEKSQGVLIPMLTTVGHVPLEISKFCYYFMNHGGEIEGKVIDNRPRRSPIPSGVTTAPATPALPGGATQSGAPNSQFFEKSSGSLTVNK